MSSLEVHPHSTPRPGLSVYYPLQPRNVSELAPFARLVTRGYADRLWLGESLALGSHQIFAHLAGQGITPALGMGVSLMPLHHPYQAAAAARSLAVLSGRPLVTVFGTASPALVAALHGAPYASPLSAAREYLTAVRQLLKGEAANVDGTYVRTTARLPAGPEAPQVEVGLGVLGPRMAAVAADTADVALTWMTPLPYLRDVLLPVLAGVRVVCVAHILVVRPGLDVHDVVLRATESHLSESHYLAMLANAGIGPLGEGPARASGLIEQRVVLVGSAEEIAQQVGHYWSAGVDEIALNPAVLETRGPEAALRDLLDVTEVCRVKSFTRKEPTWSPSVGSRHEK